MRGLSGARWETSIMREDESVLDQILESRGISGAAREAFLNPRIKDALPDPFFLSGMEAASGILADAILKGENVGIYSDYDADGATSAGVLGRWLRMMGQDPHDVVIPHRTEHGYGPHAGLLAEMFESGMDKGFILDSGTVASSVLNTLPKSQRKALVVIDHHMPSGDIPDIAAVVNPNLTDQKPGLGHLAAVGVTFLLCVAAQRELVKVGHLPQSSMQSLMELLDYVAIGTVCDVVPLVGVNRAFVHHGLQRIQRTETNPIGALLKAAGRSLDAPVQSSDCGFVIGPRLNAEGRIGDPRAAAHFLLETDPDLIRESAARLQQTNDKRKGMEKTATETAIEDAENFQTAHAVVAVAEGHVGVVGISASRLKDRYNKPSVVLTRVRDGVLQGSARSVDGFNIGEAIHEAVDAGLLIKGGGHAMAGGVTIEEKNLDAFRAHLDDASARSDFGKNGVSTSYDLVLGMKDVSVGLLDSLKKLEPCGRENPEPRFVLKDARIKDVRTMSDKHIKLFIPSPERGKDSLDVLMWNGIGTELGNRLLASKDEVLTLAGRFEINSYAGKDKVQMIVEDVLASSGPDTPRPFP